MRVDIKKWSRPLWGLLVVGVMFLAFLIFVEADSSVQAETKTLEWMRLDTEITVLPNGDLRIVETNVIAFTSGTFTFGYRDIDQSRLTGIADVLVTEQGRAQSRVLPVELSQTDEGYFRIRYKFEPARREQRVFTVEYTVQGATRYYDDGDEVFWAGVYADRNGFAVQASRLTVRLPDGATSIDARTYGPRAELRGRGDNVIVAEALESIQSGSQFEIWVKFPHGVIGGAAPAWQAGYDRQREYERTLKPVVDLFMLLLAGLVIAGGVPAAIVLWYRRGRDPQVGMVAEYLTEPPAKLSPGLAGALLDEKADMRDIVATLVDLCRRGVLRMSEEQTAGLFGIGTIRDWVFERGPQFTKQLAQHERELIRALDLDMQDSAHLSDFKDVFYKSVPGIQSALYDQMVSAGYYDHRPDKVRNRFMAVCIVVLVVGFGSLVITGLLAAEGISSTAIALSVAVGIVGAVLTIVGANMPVRTRKGAEMRQRVNAFKRYLENIERYTDLKTATDQFDRYLPFAVAFGIDRSWLRKFAAIDTPAPTWYVPHMASASSASGAGSSGSSVAGAAKASSGGIAGANAGLTSSLAGMNVGLTAMMSSVASTFSSSPSSSGGGGGGGGGSSGGGGGGFG